MNVNSAASIAMQVMQQGAAQGPAGAAASTANGALALVTAAAATAQQATAGGMIGSLINTFA
jgi:hypothetical protein